MYFNIKCAKYNLKKKSGSVPMPRKKTCSLSLLVWATEISVLVCCGAPVCWIGLMFVFLKWHTQVMHAQKTKRMMWPFSGFEWNWTCLGHTTHCRVQAKRRKTNMLCVVIKRRDDLNLTYRGVSVEFLVKWVFVEIKKCSKARLTN
jgi:hypothetical protein